MVNVKDIASKIEPRSPHTWKKYILEFINQTNRDEFKTEEVINYIKKKYGQYYEDLSFEEFEQRVKSALTKLTEEGSFRISKDFDYEFELEKHGLYDIKLEKYKNYWNVNFTTLEQHKEKQELLKKLANK